MLITYKHSLAPQSGSMASGVVPKGEEDGGKNETRDRGCSIGFQGR